MNGQSRNIIIGVFVLAAIVLVIWLILFLHPTVGDEEQILRVRFSNIEKVRLGTRVTFAGKPVGKVVAINQIYDAREHPSAAGRIFFFEVVLAIDSSIKIYTSDEVVLHTSGLFGERVIAIIPREPKPGEVATLITNQVIYAKAGDQMSDVFDMVETLADKITLAIEQITKFFDEESGDLGAAITSLRDAMSAIAITFSDINDEDLVVAFKDAATRFSYLVDDIDTAVCDLDEGGFFANLCQAFDRLAQSTEQLANGEGTLGRLIQDDEVYEETRELLEKATDVMETIDNYGLLFQLNKRWQREKERERCCR